MHRKWFVLLVTLLVAFLAFSVFAKGENGITVTVRIRNTDCSQINISQFLLIKDNSPLKVKRFLPPRTVNRGQLATFFFKLKARPTRLALTGSKNGGDFSYRIGLNWGVNEKKISCGRITAEVPYKGGLNYPVARFEWSPKEPKPGEKVRLDAGSSNGDIRYYGWGLDNDGNIDRWEMNPVIFYRWDEPGQYQVTLMIKDNSGKESRTSNTVSVTSGRWPKPRGLPNTASFSCREHGYFSQSKHRYGYLENTSSPPHDKCWGYFKAHIYPLEKYLKKPAGVSKITARVTGGISELGAVKEGFELQMLRTYGGSWETLKEFSVPCASGGKGTLLQWKANEGHLLEAIALRITAPAGGRLYVDSSAIWIEYYTGK